MSIEELIKDGLLRCVTAGRCSFMTYKGFAEAFPECDLSPKYPPAWANRNTLDAVAQDCKRDARARCLDLTFLLRNKGKGYPSVIDGEPFDGSPGQKARARKVAQDIIDAFRPGTPNPY